LKSSNKVQLIGYLGKDPVIKIASNGDTMAVLRMATHQYSSGTDGKSKRSSIWHTVYYWDEKEIEKLKNYLIKGSHIMVDGSIFYRTYTDKNGTKNTVAGIRAEHVTDLDR